MGTNKYPDSWDWANPNHGERITGMVTDRRNVNTKYGPREVLEIRSEEHSGTAFTVWCSSKALEDFLADLNPQPGDKVTIARMGKEEWTTKSGEARSMWVFDYGVLTRAGEDAFGNPAPEQAGQPPIADEDIPFAASIA